MKYQSLLLLLAIVAAQIWLAANQIVCPPSTSVCPACQNGYANDCLGCPTCNCCCVLPATDCRYCPNGYVNGWNGCPTCKCKCLPTPAVCVVCQYGYKNDQYGCATCQCCPQPTASPTSVSPCTISCPNGYVLDPTTGCKTCACCPLLPCKYCANGYLTGNNGCPTCNCKPCPPPCQTCLWMLNKHLIKRYLHSVIKITHHTHYFDPLKVQ